MIEIRIYCTETPKGFKFEPLVKVNGCTMWEGGDTKNEYKAFQKAREAVNNIRQDVFKPFTVEDMIKQDLRG